VIKLALKHLAANNLTSVNWSIAMETIRLEDLIQRWNLKNRQAVHARFKQLRTKGVNIEPVAPGLYNAELLPLLDRYHEFLKGGGNINFFDFGATDVELIDMQHVNNQSMTTSLPERQDGQITIEQATKLIGVVASLIKVPGLEGLEWLEKAALNNWQLSTSQVRDLIGRKPAAKNELPFLWGSFYFVRVGRMGRQYSWLVRKLNPKSPKLTALPIPGASFQEPEVFQVG
jgi:hypothetical protein